MRTDSSFSHSDDESVNMLVAKIFYVDTSELDPWLFQSKQLGRHQETVDPLSLGCWLALDDWFLTH